MSRAFYGTTPIYYVNAEPHIGHTYTTVVVDTLARYHRMAGHRTFFLTGTDEHGDKIAEVAREEGVPPQEIADRYSAKFRDAWQELGFSPDRFIRTTDADHARVVQHVLQELHDAGQIDFREYEGLYCVGCERFLTDRDMVDGLCRDHERAPERRRESNYFFRMSEHFPWLVQHIHDHPDFIRPERYRNEALGMLREDSGLGDLSISRPRSRLDWGIELPFDRDYVCYVWFDALINYVTAVGYPDAPGFGGWWGAAEHFIGKDILKPHAVFWPCMLHALGLPPYRHLNVHGYWNMDARKVSKSLGNLVSPLIMRDRYGFEAFRYYLLREMAFGVDSEFSEAGLVARINGDLANNLGNLVSRTLNMTDRYAGGRVPEAVDSGPGGTAVADAAARACESAVAHLERYEFHRALEAILALTAEVNRYLEERAPWKVAKERAAGWEGHVGGTLRTGLDALRSVSVLLAPFLPETAARIASRLGLEGLLDGARYPDDAAFGALAPGGAVHKGAPLFPRVEAGA